MQDVLIGTWKLNPERSQFDANHRPRAGTMVLERSPEGHYIIKAEGLNAKGEKVKERPTTLIADGQSHAIPDFAGLSVITTKPDPNTIQTEARREDGSIVGGGSYSVSADGKTLTATTFGYDTQLRQFKQFTVWDRE